MQPYLPEEERRGACQLCEARSVALTARFHEIRDGFKHTIDLWWFSIKSWLLLVVLAAICGGFGNACGGPWDSSGGYARRFLL